MANYKYIFVAVAALVFAVFATEVSSAYRPYAGANSHNLTVGTRQPGDYLVVRENVVKNSQLWQVVTLQRTYNTTSKYQRITQVKALDQSTNGKGAYASLISGGPGSNNVTLRFKSQRNHSIKFIVELYAR